MYNKDFKFKQQVIKSYLENKTSLRTTALKYGIHYQTLYKWVKRYRKQGAVGVLINYKKSWNKTPPSLENKIVIIKENIPQITVRAAQKLLKKDGYEISLNGIWNVWRRYGYCGFNWVNIGNDFTEFGKWSKEAEHKLYQAQTLVKNDMIRDAADILNSIPFLPGNSLLSQVPDDLLNTERRLEKIYIQFGHNPITDSIDKLDSIYREFVKKRYYFTALRAGLAIVSALTWLGQPKKILTWTNRLEKILWIKAHRKSRLFFPLFFTLLFGRAAAYLALLKIKKAFEICRSCAQMIFRRKHLLYNFLADLGNLYNALEDYQKTEKILKLATPGFDEEKRKDWMTEEAIHFHLFRGDIKRAKTILKRVQVYDWAKNAYLNRYWALIALNDGKPFRAIELAQEALVQSKKENLRLSIANAYLIEAIAQRSLDEEGKVKHRLRSLLSFLDRNQMKRHALVVRILLGEKIKPSARLLSTIQLIWLIRCKGYRIALDYALKKGIILYFYFYLFFFPEVVLNEMKLGKNLKLPLAILRLPVYNKEKLVFHFNIFGKFEYYRNKEHFKAKLTPKDFGLLIHFALRAPEPDRGVTLSEIYANFWPRVKNPGRNLSHALMRIKKTMKIPVHFLQISRITKPRLVNKGILFTTDYREFEQILTQAKALERAEEWVFAKKEYLRAFKLFRGEPFKKMYDPWSEQMRMVILNKLETEAVHFAMSCLEHNNKRDAKRVLEKTIKIMPKSMELRDLLENCNSNQ
jgi:transposase-like protein